MKSILIIALLFFSSNCFSQKEDYIWLGGYDWDADIKDTILSTEGYRLDFNKTNRG